MPPPPPSRPTVHTLVFDLDNTLVDTLDLIVDAFNAVMVSEVGRPLSRPEVVAYFGPTEENCIRAAVRATHPDQAIERFRRHYANEINAIRPYPGIQDILLRLRRAGRTLALCTGKGRWTTEITLQALGLADTFSVVMTGDDVTRNKPDPEPLFRIARQTGCGPERLLMIGDALADVRAARAAGARGLLVLWGHPDPRPGHHDAAVHEAHALFHSIPELDRWLEQEGVYRDGKIDQDPSGHS